VGMLLTAINQGEIFKFITKPWKLEEEFKSVIQQAIEYYDLKAERDGLAAQLEKYTKGDAEKVGAADGNHDAGSQECPPMGEKRMVLFVDDEEKILKGLQWG